MNLIVAAVFAALPLIDDGHDDEIVEVTFDDLRFEYVEDGDDWQSQIPSSIRRLHDRHIRIRGFLYGPSFSTRQSSSFLLVRDNQEYFPWPLCNNIDVVMAMGHSIGFTVAPVELTGRFRIVDLARSTSGDLEVVYELSDATVVEQ